MTNQKYYGGVATALRFAKFLAAGMPARLRIIGEETFDGTHMPQFKDYVFRYADEDTDDQRVISRYRSLSDKSICVENKDIFITTYWTTMYKYKSVCHFQKQNYGCNREIIYLIQDFEPSFFKWSAYYLLAESTYKEKNTIAVFNTLGLMNYVNRLGYKSFSHQFYFEPQLNSTLKKNLNLNEDRKNELIIYGRPRNARNCFPLIVEALKKVVESSDKANDWEFVSIGTKHKDWNLGNGKILKSKGKLPLDQYCKILKEAKIGISLMCSPHPSYPPLEMAAFGVRTITNNFVDKNIQSINSNLIVLDKVTIEDLAKVVIEQIDNYSPQKEIKNNQFERFIQEEDVEFNTIGPQLIKILREQ